VLCACQKAKSVWATAHSWIWPRRSDIVAKIYRVCVYNPNLHFHFTGIGGSGMSGIAEVLLTNGFRVSGSDLSLGATCQRLIKLGAKIYQGHSAENLDESISLVVYSSAVSKENPELVEAAQRGLPVIARAEVLAELMRLKYGVAVAGSHGKTTTTSMIAAVLEHGGLDPTVIIGGQVRSMASGGKVGKGNFLVAESDESDRSFLLLKPTIAVVTNIDGEHLSAYASLTELEESFNKFVDAVPFYGLAVLCVDDIRVRSLTDGYSRRKITYGLSPDAQIRAVNIRALKSEMSFDVIRDNEQLGQITLPMPGRHLLVNSLASVAVGLELNVSFSKIQQALNNFAGVKRRLEVLGEVDGITVINDYGHHPTEIKASIAAVRAGWDAKDSRLHVVFQPHRFTRTRDCFVEFLDAFQACDNLVLTEIYAASEAPIPGVSGQLLSDSIIHPSKRFVSSLENIGDGLRKDLSPGDVVLFLGAGSIGPLAEQFFAELAHSSK
jgi:UDP-N-acetylmuramate--alanine ligase